MSKYKSKGCVFAVSSSGSYGAIGGLTSISVTGEKSETIDTTTLDGGVYKTKDPSGYSNPAVIKASGFYDPSVFSGIQALIATPVATNVKVTYTDSGPTSVIYSGTGFGLDKKAEVGKAIMADLEIETSGAPS